MEITVLNQQEKIDWSGTLESTVTKCLGRVAEVHSLPVDAQVSVVLVDDRQIRELNLHYRGLDSPTDVLSFAINEAQEGEPGYEEPAETETLLGDIVISLETAARQSQEYSHSMAREVAFLAVHGMLHLLGYDHQDEEGRKAMRAAEESILTAVGLER